MFRGISWSSRRLAAVAAAVIAVTVPSLAQCFDGTASTTKTCNCTDSGAKVKTCHESSVDVTIGDRHVGSVSTGQSSSTCFEQDIPPGQCVWIEYHFKCCREGFWPFYYWECTPTSNALHSGAATVADCS